jgi:hypothetical protein
MMVVADALRWHYYKKADAENWNQDTEGIGLPDELVEKFEGCFAQEVIDRLLNEAQTWANYEISHVSRVKWPEILIMAFPKEYRDTYYYAPDSLGVQYHG